MMRFWQGRVDSRFFSLVLIPEFLTDAFSFSKLAQIIQVVVEHWHKVFFVFGFEGDDVYLIGGS